MIWRFVLLYFSWQQIAVSFVVVVYSNAIYAFPFLLRNDKHDS
jgi:hypothetical protein